MTTTKTIYAKFAKAKSEFSSIKKDTTATNYKYAELEQVIAATDPALISNGLLCLQDIEEAKLITYIIDIETGDKLHRCTLPIETMDVPTSREGKPLMNKLQAYGSTLSYLRRYGRMIALDLATEDDDGKGPQVDVPKKPVKTEPIDKQKLQAEIISLWANKYTQAMDANKDTANKIEAHIENKFTECNDEQLLAIKNWLLKLGSK